MKLIADLHIHSKHSRATSNELNIKNLEKYARIKGVNLLGTGDFTHPEWFKEIKEELKDDGTGFLKTKSGFPFVLQTEISLIYTQGDKGRRVHTLILAPNIETVEKINSFFKSIGRVDYDGRPIFKLSCIDLVKRMKSISDDIEIIPAHCLIPDSLIHTKKGLKEIREITKGNIVLTHKGNYKTVKKIYKNKYKGDIYKIVPSLLKMGSYFTPEHPIYSIKTFKTCKNVPHTVCKPSCAYLKRGCKSKKFNDYKKEWNQIKDLEKGDIVLFPRYNINKDKKYIFLKKLIPHSFIENEYIKSRNTKPFVKNKLIKNKINITKDFCRLIGYYLAEGYISREYIGFTFSKKESAYINDVKGLLKEYFGEYLKIKIKEENSEGISIIVYSKILVEFFKFFYHEKPYRSFNKYLPSWIVDLPDKKITELLIGWWRGDTGYTSSRNLCNQMKLILLKLGIIPSINVTSYNSVNLRREKKCNMIMGRRIKAKKDIFHFHNLSFFKNNFNIINLPEFKKFKTKLNRRKGWIDKDYIYLPISSIKKKKYNGLVYNLEVNVDNSYLTENLAVHNCWTPWFGILGSKSGFNSLKEAFGEYEKEVHAIETGLSSDPPMNWRLKQLDDKAILSFSDLHSFWPWRIGREATVFDIEPNYRSLLKAIRTREGLVETIEVDPSYGKYHFDGHRNCNISFSPEESKKNNNICPVCKSPLTIGVLNRVEELADRPEGYIPKDAKPYRRLIPLTEIISIVIDSGLSSNKSWVVYNELVKESSELNVLLEMNREEIIVRTKNEKLADAILKNREGKIEVIPGYDGEYGVPIIDGKKAKIVEFNNEKKEKIENKKKKEDKEKREIKNPQKGLSEFLQ